MQLVIRANFPRYMRTKDLWVRTLRFSTPLRVQYPHPVPCLFSFPDRTLFFSERVCAVVILEPLCPHGGSSRWSNFFRQQLAPLQGSAAYSLPLQICNFLLVLSVAVIRSQPSCGSVGLQRAHPGLPGAEGSDLVGRGRRSC